MQRFVSWLAAAMVLAALCIGCTQSKPPPRPPKSVTYSGQVCKIYRSYAKAKFTNLDGRFNDTVELPLMLSRALPYFPTSNKRGVQAIIKYLSAMRDNSTDPKALAEIQSDKEFGGTEAKLAMTAALLSYHDTCMKSTDIGY